MFARFASKPVDAGSTRGEALFPRASIRDASNGSRVNLTSPRNAVASRSPSKPI